MIEILHIDDHKIFRSGIRRLMLDEPDIRVAGEASNGSEALELLASRRFDLALLDISMEGRSGLELLERIRAIAPKMPVLMLSMYPEEQYALLAVRNGANGYLSKDTEASELVGAIRKVAAGGQYLSVSAVQHVRAQLTGTDNRPPHQRLSTREHQIMLMLLKGMSLTAVGEEMMISVKTVSTHRTNILEKLGVSSTAELVLYAVRQGLAH